MPRIARIVVPGCPHHITHRGNNRQKVFLTKNDYATWFVQMKHYSNLYGLNILGYCLMPNHVHIIAIPEYDYSLAKTIGLAHMRYAQITNLVHNRTGHLWGDRFYSCAIDDSHLVASMRYTEQNPVRAGISKLIEDNIDTLEERQVSQNPGLLEGLFYGILRFYVQAAAGGQQYPRRPVHGVQFSAALADQCLTQP